MNYWYIQQPRWIIKKALCWVKEVSTRRLYIVWFQLNGFLKKIKLKWGRTDYSFQELGRWGDSTGSFGGNDGAVVYPDSSGYMNMYESTCVQILRHVH